MAPIPDTVQAVAQTTAGAALVATPWLADLLTIIQQGLGFVAVLCGAIIGLHGVWRLIRRRFR